jgi:prolyl-tRNA synthetase
LPGDREVDEKRLEAAVAPSEVEPFTDEDFAAYPALVKGYIGPVKLSEGGQEQVLGKDFASGVEYLVDPRVVKGTRWVTGANAVDQHQIDVVYGRDFVADGVLDVAEVREGDPSPDGSGPLVLARGVECGHIFQLGTKYAEALGLQVLDQNGKLVTVTMGSYGFGVSRAVAVVAGKHYDDKGLAWPRNVAPFDVHIVAAGKDEAVVEAAEALAAQLGEAGVEVLLDDRKASPGVKFADAELIGVPTSVVVGRGLQNGVIEIKDRATLERQEVPVAKACETLLSIIRG